MFNFCSFDNPRTQNSMQNFDQQFLTKINIQTNIRIILGILKEINSATFLPKVSELIIRYWVSE